MTSWESSYFKFTNGEIFVDRLKSTLHTYVDKSDTWHVYSGDCHEFTVRILVDRSQLEIYVNDVTSITTRIYPKYGDSDYISLFDNKGNMNITKFKVTQMKGCFVDDPEPAYYGNVGNLSEVY